MVVKAQVLSSLKSINRLYKRTAGTKDTIETLLYSKIAILEFGGWIEESMDDIVERCAKRCLVAPSNLKKVQNPVIKRNYGFLYEEHFSKMLRQVIGFDGLEELEKVLDPTKLALLKSGLVSMTTIRNSLAHTHIKGTARSIEAPSSTIARFESLYEGLKDIDIKLRLLKL